MVGVVKSREGSACGFITGKIYSSLGGKTTTPQLRACIGSSEGYGLGQRDGLGRVRRAGFGPQA